MLAPEPVDGIDLALLCDCDPRAVGFDEPYGLDGDFAPLRRLREDRRRIVLGIVAYRYRADERVDAIVVAQRVGATLQDEERAALARDRALLLLREGIELGARRKRNRAGGLRDRRAGSAA